MKWLAPALIIAGVVALGVLYPWLLVVIVPAAWWTWRRC